MTAPLFQSFECSACVSDWRDYKRQVRSTVPGDKVPDWPHKDCERPDCAMFDAMLDDMDQTDLSGTAEMLRRLRAQMVKPEYRKQAQEWMQQQEQQEERQRALDIPLVTDHWDHTIPAEIDEVLSAFDDERLAWLRCKTAWHEARDARLHAIALCGPSKSGKTCAACRWLQGIAGGRFITAARLVAKREAAVTSHDRTELEVLKRAPALVIDDMDRVQLTEADRGRIAELVRSRESAGKPTVMTMIKAKSVPPSLVKRMRIAIAG